MRHGKRFGDKTRWLLIGCGALLAGCGGRASRNDVTGGASGGEPARGGAGGTAATPGGSGGSGTDSGGAAWEPPPPVDPAVSKAWTWSPCGTLESEPADRAALFDDSGRIVVLGASDVRLHDVTGERTPLSSGTAADFLVTASDGSVLIGRLTAAGVTLTPVGESTPDVVLPVAPDGACGSHFALSADGAYLLATGVDIGCAWSVADSSFVGSVKAEQVTIRNSRFVTVERAESSTDVVQRDFAGSELSRRALGDGPVFLSPAGDRAIRAIDNALVDLDSGGVVAWDVAPSTFLREPRFSPRGEVVLLGDAVFSTADGVRRFRVDPAGRLATGNFAEMQLSADGSRAVSLGFGRATLFDIEEKGISAVLGPPVVPDPSGGHIGTSDLAISRDGGLLVQNIVGSAAFGLRLAEPNFSDSKVLWDMRVEINLSVDVSGDSRLATVGGDGRATYDARDGHPVWASPPPPPGVSADDICLLDGLRFSPKGTWLAGSDYARKLQIFQTKDAAPWQPMLELPGRCDAAAFSHDERLMATSAAALYRTGPAPGDWTQVWSSSLPTPGTVLGWPIVSVQFSPDEKQLLVSRCAQIGARCVTTLLNAATGAVERRFEELEGPHPVFSPDGSWIVAANQLLHLPSGEVRTLSAEASPTNPAIFTPDGDIIAGSVTGALTRYCRK